MSEGAPGSGIAQFPSALRYLFQPFMPDGVTPVRYRVGYGGRGGAKTWNYARALLMLGTASTKRVLCGREYQNSIKESVHKVLADQLDSLNMNYIYEVQNTTIKARDGATLPDGSPNKTDFIFKGFHQNMAEIKSTEGIDIGWVEEANKTTKASWDTLDPTIRKPGSELWISFNPELETDETYQRFVVNPPDNALVVKLSWRDNPWFPDVLRKQMEQALAKNYDDYLHIWEGECKQILEGAVYANEIRLARAEGRICRVPYNPTFPVDVIFDLGKRDLTAAWFRQRIAYETRLIDYFQESQKDVEDYLEILKKRNYFYGTIWLPHDAKAKRLGTKHTIQEQFQAAFGKKNVRIVPRLSIADGINAARTGFHTAYFDKVKCADGIQCLTHYRYEIVDDLGSFSKEPVHDIYSHGSDAYRYEAISRKLAFVANEPPGRTAARERNQETMDALRAQAILGGHGHGSSGGAMPSAQGWMRN